jgi:hypothetical protein
MSPDWPAAEEVLRHAPLAIQVPPPDTDDIFVETVPPIRVTTPKSPAVVELTVMVQVFPLQMELAELTIWTRVMAAWDFGAKQNNPTATNITKRAASRTDRLVIWENSNSVKPR